MASESTAAVDEDDKPGDYLSVSSITDYLIFEQDRRRVRHRRRADATPATWDVETLTGPDAAVRLAGPAVEFSLGGRLRRRDVSRRVNDIHGPAENSSILLPPPRP